MSEKDETNDKDLRKYIDKRIKELEKEVADLKAQVAEKGKRPRDESFEESMEKFKEGAISLAAFTYSIADELASSIEQTRRDRLDKKSREVRERLANELEEMARKLRK